MAAEHFHEPVPQLSDAIVLLRRRRPGDAASVHEACQDPEISRWIPAIPVPYSLEDAQAFIAGIGGEAWDAGVQAAFAIVDPVSDRLLGAIGLHAHEPRRWEIGYWVVPGGADGAARSTPCGCSPGGPSASTAWCGWA